MTRQLDTASKMRTFIGMRPTQVFTAHGVTLYEHPKLGDESPLLAVWGRKIYKTDFWDAPHRDELLQWRKDKEAAMDTVSVSNVL